MMPRQTQYQSFGQNMADIFLSYSSQDRERITPLIQSLEQQGWSVWWDRRIPPGKTYDQVIEQALDEARCVVVVWSQTSVQSEWVKVEADEGMNRRILVPVMIEEARIPLAFRRIQAARLIGWQAPASHPELDLLFETIRTIVGEPATAKKDSEREQVRDDARLSAKFDEEVVTSDSPPPAPVFTPLVQPTSIHSIPPVQYSDPGGVREPRDDDSVSFEKVSPKRSHLLLPKFAGGAKHPLLAFGTVVILLGIVIVIALNKQSRGVYPSQTTSGIGDRPASPALSTFEFDVIALDENGRERERHKGQAKSFAEELGDGVKLEMVEIPGGEFTMGSPNNEADRSNDEGPQYRVTIQQFFMSKFEITQAQWRAVARLPKVGIEELKPDPSHFKGDDLPVESVSWYEVREFCRRLARVTGREYRLPSEAEWEYAARARTTTPFAFGPTITPEIVNYDGNYLKVTG
jgi:hypothetical protein